MTRSLGLCAVLFLILPAGTTALAESPPAPRAPLVYPQPPRAAVVDTYWGTPVPDPYRPLENVDAPEPQAWLRAEAALTRGYLDALPYRAEIKAAFTGPGASTTRQSVLEQHGNFWSSSRYAAGKRRVTLVRDGALQPDRVLLDENELPPNVSVAYINWSPSGRLIAYATETNGSDWLTWRVRDVATATDLPDVLRWSKYSFANFNGDEGFYYSGYGAPPAGHENDAEPPVPYKAFYHRLGTPQSADPVLATARSDDDFPYTFVSDDGRYAMAVTTSPADTDGIAIFPADHPAAPRRTLLEPARGRSWYITNLGTRFYFRTNIDAPNDRVVEVDAGDPQYPLRTIIPDRADTLVDASFIAGRFYLNYLHDVHNVLKIADIAGRQVGSIALPGLGTATVPQPAGDGESAYYSYESFIQPRVTYRYDLKTGQSTPAAQNPTRFDPTPYVTEQLFATSKDGTRVPVFVTHRRDVKYDGSTPTILWSYAAYGSLSFVTPVFYGTTALWLRMGGAYAVVNARGGGEYGERWHRAGMLAQKQHGLDDVIAAAEMLIARKLTSPAKLALSGASMGGIMAGAVAVERPDLFAAALLSAAPLDLLRYQKYVAGAPMISEIGSSEQSEAAFRTLYAYSPLQNVRAGTRYPAMLIATGDHDDRVFPAHSYKFAAALQQAQAGSAPILLAVRQNAGHDFGVAGTAADDIADRYAFLAKVLDFRPSLSQ